MHRLLCLLSVVLAVCGCSLLDTERRIRSEYYILHANTTSLTGPYALKEVMSSTSMRIAQGAKETIVELRGCRGTGNADIDEEGRQLLQTIWPDGVYLRDDFSMVLGDNRVRGIAYEPARRNMAGVGQDGLPKYEILTYTMPQLLNVLIGYCYADHSDTNYPLYRIFAEAEQVAKQRRKGIWAIKRR